MDASTGFRGRVRLRLRRSLFLLDGPPSYQGCRTLVHQVVASRPAKKDRPNSKMLIKSIHIPTVTWPVNAYAAEIERDRLQPSSR